LSQIIAVPPRVFASVPSVLIWVLLGWSG
jgi:hypothetical protein